MKDFIKRLWNGVDSFAFNTTAIVIYAIGAFVGMAVGFAGYWYGWLYLGLCIAGSTFFIFDLNRVRDLTDENGKKNR